MIDWLRRFYHEWPDVTVKVYPTLAEGARLPTGTSAWTMPGTYTEIVPVDTITEDFWIIGVDAKLFTSGGTTAQQKGHALELAKGAAGSESSIVEATGMIGLSTGVKGVAHALAVPIKVAANTRIAGRAADEDTTDRDLVVAVIYALGL